MTAWTADKLFSSKKQDWATPWHLFNVLDAEFNFTLDAAASPSNHKCHRYLKKDGLTQSWTTIARNGAVWLNPPYGKEVGKWVEKAYRESLAGSTVVCLTFARTDTRWWHNWAMKAAEIRLIKGRIKFEGATSSAPAPSCLLIFDENRKMPRFTTQQFTVKKGSKP